MGHIVRRHWVISAVSKALVVGGPCIESRSRLIRSACCDPLVESDRGRCCDPLLMSDRGMGKSRMGIHAKNICQYQGK